MHVAGEELGDAHDSPPFAKFAWNLWFAAMAVSTALLGTPGAIPTPPKGVITPAEKRGSAGAFTDRIETGV